jgi:hypothetical protein
MSRRIITVLSPMQLLIDTARRHRLVIGEVTATPVREHLGRSPGFRKFPRWSVLDLGFE